MQNFTRALVLFLGTLLCGGCVTPIPHQESVPKDYVIQQNSGKGILVLSTTFTGVVPEVIPSLYFRNLDDKSEHRLLMTDGRLLESQTKILSMGNFTGAAVTLPLEDPMGLLHVVELPVGSYEIYAVKGGSVQTVHLTTSPSFRCPFMVYEGVALYLGNCNFDYQPYNAMQRSMVRIENKQDRDLALLKARYPQIDQNNMIIAIEKSGLKLQPRRP